MTRHLDLTSVPIPSSSSYERGKFGRLFPWLPPCVEDAEKAYLDMVDIARTMFVNGWSEVDNESDMPAGYTYLGQFIIHDISFDPTSFHERQVDPEFLWNFRTPSLDLDSVYGGGPFISPYFYDPLKNNGLTHFLLPEKPIEFGSKDPAFFDLPRNKSSAKTAIIPDPRNDENIIISQIHASFLQFHNYLADRLGETQKEKYQNRPRELFRAVQQAVKWHYQWVLLYDYLPRIVDLRGWEDLTAKTGIAKTIRNNMMKLPCVPIGFTVKQIEILAKGEVERKFYDWRNEPFIPLEFSVAAFRFGHSQVRNEYQFNRDPSTKETGTGEPIYREKELFSIPPRLSKEPTKRVAMPFFFPKHGVEFFNKSKRIEPVLNNIMKGLPINTTSSHKTNLTSSSKLCIDLKNYETNLAVRNLIRGIKLGLPSGQNVAKAMGIKPESMVPFDKFKLKGFPAQFVDNTPLWFYILYEARKLREGKRLGPVGSRIVAEVIIGLLQGDKTSFLNQDPNWVPKNKAGGDNHDFDMADLLELAGVYTP